MNNDSIREELLAALAELGERHPQWRLGQTLANVAMSAGRLEAGGVWDLEDDEVARGDSANAGATHGRQS